MLQANALLALAAAVLWGGGDFAGGMGAKHSGSSVPGALRVVMTSHASSLLVLTIIGLLRGDALPHGAALGWSILSGAMGCLSVTMFYIALSRGAMGASAAVSGLLAAAIPSTVAIAHDGRPGWMTLVGFVIAGSAIWLIAAGENPEATPASAGTMWLAVASGAGFGIYFVALKYAAAAGLVWPMATARLTSVLLGSTMVLGMALTAKDRGMRKIWLPKKAILWGLATAFGDTTGNLLFMAATRAGRLDVASVLASLYPASTILLAAWTLHERPTRRQGIGMAIAAVAVIMITL
ncbi:MAG: DMT family transporter [Edaphobacter sp.]|uniref:DMT family transporter n=1 Tax=Edaphobacter sp. TaxID=1934404 RepID=UPI00239B2B9E|nr:DMT family transporter [Edaphobacter sp.]MDE1175948.1 DMT family transporter [Edaphobacter sp.]